MIGNIDVRDLDPSMFYGLVALMGEVDQKAVEELRTVLDGLDAFTDELERQTQDLETACRRLSFETGLVTRRKSGFKTTFDDDEVRDTQGGPGNFLALVLVTVSTVREVASVLASTVQGLEPGKPVLRSRKFTGEVDDFDELQHMVAEFSLNLPILRRFSTALVSLDNVRPMLLKAVHHLTDQTEAYRRRLQQRHGKDGMPIHGSPVATDVALAIFTNVDGHGEIEDGRKPDEISAYSIRRAKAMAHGVRTGVAKGFVQDPLAFIEFSVANIRRLLTFCGALEIAFEKAISGGRDLVPELRKRGTVTVSQISAALAMLEDLDPNQVPHKESTKLLSPEERYHLNFVNDTVRRIVKMLGDADIEDDALVRYVLDRKAELHDYYKDENSFYVCRISTGNSFMGEAPGALEVVPGTRPTVNLDEIFGTGYADLRAHASTIEATAKWHDLFVASSPSKTADKSNVLMVGPQGCGKSEVLRGVGAHRGSVGIFAVGSDFNTCWAGEAQKNPKRLFEAAVKLEKETRKHVHILIDEIDSVLNDDKDARNHFNLRLEFQLLMDGVVHYPRITIWGATNNIERIPMPMIRRFSKVAIVGELDQAERVHALRHFAEHMPTLDYTDQAWEAQAKRLAGATGDVIRKVVDHVWREKMSRFVDQKPEAAEAVRRWLNAGDQKFTISEFTTEKRSEFKKILGSHVAIAPGDIDRSIEFHLDNVAIHHEIETAVRTYEGARQFLAKIREARAV
jgi:AAA+ superfamily predicted ATPase